MLFRVLIYRLNLTLQVDFVLQILYHLGFLDSRRQNPTNNMFERHIFLNNILLNMQYVTLHLSQYILLDNVLLIKAQIRLKNSFS